MVIMPGIRRSNGGLNAVYNSADFYLPLKENGIIPHRAPAGVSATFTRATTSYAPDFEDVPGTKSKWNLLASGEVPIWGARRVRNLISSSDLTTWTKQNLGTGSAPVVTNNYAAAPDGTITATRVQVALNGGTTAGDASDIYCALSETFSAGDSALVKAYVKTNDGTRKKIFLSTNGATTKRMVTADGNWRELHTIRADEVSTLCMLGLQGGQPNVSLSDSADLLIWAVSVEKITGQSDKTPAETQSVGVLAAPYQGFGIDGVKNYWTKLTSTKLACYGDSMTIGAYTGMSYPMTLSRDMVLVSADNNGVSGETSTQIKTRLLADTTLANKTVIIWAGRNNYADPVTVKADIAAMVAYLGHTNYLVLSITNGEYASEYSGGADYVKIVQLNTDLAAIYGSRFVDVRTPLVNAYDAASAQDVIDHGRDIVPDSLRLDVLHPNTLGYKIVADTVGSALSSVLGVTEGAYSSVSAKGYFPFAAATQLVTPTASIRDMTDASWVKVGAPTVTKTATGIDGVANSATKIVATAATTTLIQTLVAAASSRTYAQFIKKVIGTPTISLTQDNGATWTDVTSSVTTGSFARTQLTASVLNAAFGIKIVGNVGDEVHVDFNQFESGAVATPPIGAAGATRNADVDSYATTGMSVSAGTIYLEYTPKDATSTNRYLWGSYTDANNALQILHDGTNFTARKRLAAANNDSTKATVLTAGTKYKIAMRWSSVSGVDIFVNGVKGTNNANTTNAVIAAIMQIGADGNSANQADGGIASDYRWATALTDAALLAMTT